MEHLKTPDHTHRQGWKSLVGIKHANFFGLFVNYKEKVTQDWPPGVNRRESAVNRALDGLVYPN